MKALILYSLVLLSLTIFLYAALKQHLEASELKFNTKKTRELWQVCSMSFRSKHPGVPPSVYTPVCDCYVDHIRTNYEPDVLDIMTPEESDKLAQGLRDTCNPKNLKEENFT